MADMMAIVAKAVFEKTAGKSPALGTQLHMDRYVSANKNLAPLGDGGKLYLVTVRPPDEALWLVAILDNPAHNGTAWVAPPSPTPLTDISELRPRIKFESGAGITMKPGALGMSLQTPRALTADDVALLDAAATGTALPVTRASAIPGAPADASDGKAGFPAAPRAASAFGTATGERRGSLLGAVLEDPASDAARQVYADQLSANNDPRGEYILVEIALAGPLSIRKREQLVARRRELVEAHAATWWPYTASHWRSSRGFLEVVSGTLEQLQAIGTKLFAAEPVTEVTVLDLDSDDVGELLKASWFPRVRRLVIRGSLGDDGFAALCKSKRTSELRALNVTATELGSEGLAMLKGGLPSCTNLVLTSNPLGDEAIEGLRRWKQLARVETLYLSGCELSSEGLETLLAAPLPRLAKLCLSNNELDDSCADVIASNAANLPALAHLELKNIGLGMDGLTALAATPLPALRRLDVRKNELSALDPPDPRVRVA